MSSGQHCRRGRQTESWKITSIVKALVLLLGLSVLPAALAEPSAVTRREIEYLLGYVGESGCEFYRNGIRYQSKTAQAHLRRKYEYLTALQLIAVTEDFIAKAATRSSVTGQPYEIRCGGGVSLPSNQWLSDVLLHFRALP